MPELRTDGESILFPELLRTTGYHGTQHLKALILVGCDVFQRVYSEPYILNRFADESFRDPDAVPFIIIDIYPTFRVIARSIAPKSRCP
jgi:hypothetical protein